MKNGLSQRPPVRFQRTRRSNTSISTNSASSGHTGENENTPSSANESMNADSRARSMR